MEIWIESSINKLYKSTVDAFPNTTKRQHSVDPIVIKKLDWIPFLGMKTLFIKGLAQNERREYGPIVVFKNVNYNAAGRHTVEFVANDGKEYVIEQLSFNDTDVLLKCPCKDFFWRWTHTDHLDKSLYGRNRKKYEAKYNPGSSNPQELPGMCKHLIKMIVALQESGIIK